MSLLVIPNVLVNGTGPANIVDAVGLNANFTAIATAVNNIYPSQILPITTGQATFGATATGVGYKFLANDATATPLTISGVTSQSADILDVTLTSGGTKTFGVNSAGVVFTGTGPSAAATNAGNLSVATSATGGAIAFGSGTAAQTGALAFSANVFTVQPNLSTGSVASFAAAGITFGEITSVTSSYFGVTALTSLSVPVNAASGDLIGQRGTNTGAVQLGGATTNGRMDFNILTAGQFSFFNETASAYCGLTALAFSVSSDASLKTNIAPIANGTASVMALKPSSFNWIANAAPGLGFLAQDVQAVLPDLVQTDNHGLLGVNYDGIIPVLVKAFQELNAAYTAYVAAHP